MRAVIGSTQPASPESTAVKPMPLTLNTILLASFLSSSCTSPSAPDSERLTLRPSAPSSKGEVVSEMSKNIWVVFQAKNGDYWFGSDGQGVYRYDGKTIVNFSTKNGLVNDRVREILEDKSGNIYFGTLNGFNKFDGKQFTQLTPRADGEWKLEPDDLWFKGDSMAGGPYRYDGKSLYHLKFPKHYLEDKLRAENPSPPASIYGVYTIYKDTKGAIWFGTAAVGAYRFDGKTMSMLFEEHLTNPPGGGSFGIRSIIEDKNGKFWICNTQYRFAINPGYKIEDKKSLVNYKREKGIDLLKLQHGGNSIYYNGIAKDNNHDLWMSTYGEGAWRYDGEKLMEYSVKDGGKDVLFVSTYKDNRGDIWLGSQGSGPYRFNGKSFEKFMP